MRPTLLAAVIAMVVGCGSAQDAGPAERPEDAGANDGKTLYVFDAPPGAAFSDQEQLEDPDLPQQKPRD